MDERRLCRKRVRFQRYSDAEAAGSLETAVRELRQLTIVKHRGRTGACSGARGSVFAVIRRLRRAPADAWR